MSNQAWDRRRRNKRFRRALERGVETLLETSRLAVPLPGGLVLVQYERFLELRELLAAAVSAEQARP